MNEPACYDEGLVRQRKALEANQYVMLMLNKCAACCDKL